MKRGRKLKEALGERTGKGREREGAGSVGRRGKKGVGA